MYHLIWFTVPGQTPPECSFLQLLPHVCKLAEINANDLDKVLNLTSPGLLCSLPTTEHRTNEIKCVLGARGIWPPWHLWGVSVLMIYTATKTSENLQLRVIFTASFQCCKWASLGCLMGGRGAEESEEMPLCWLRWENDTRLEKRDSTPLFLVCRERQPKHFGLVFWAITPITGLSNSSSELARSESVSKVYLLLVAMKTKAAAIE